ncbi:biotin--[acetyl-CoA-carboxylase] ligase [Goodfellowiella coeruleoviolacea]|uniref:biotin--[acetyl-CoA-carboxylase] ligase n=1 Tax=Goodfellowiella coeruleoviolacea TaxID=334858 RepID=UPI002646D2F1
MSVNRPLDVHALRAALVAPTGPYAALTVLDSTGSTNADLAEAAGAGAADRTVLIAEEQTAGRGRQQREWSSPKGSGLYVSVLLRPAGVPAARLSWLPLLAGVALVAAIGELTTLTAALKWPNDLLIGPEQRKAAGILAEAVSAPADRAVVVGMGINVSQDPAELPVRPGALPPTSLVAAGATDLSRQELAAALLRRFAELEREWRASGGDPSRSGLWQAYREVCATIGQQVRVEFPDGTALTGAAVGVDEDGRLTVRDPAGVQRSLSAGDVVHVRPVR